MKDNYGVQCNNSGDRTHSTQFEVVSSFRSSFSGLMMGYIAKGSLSAFSYYDPIKKICKLCYESVYPIKVNDGYVMINTLDKKPHRVKVGNSKSFYCKMAKKPETQNAD